MSNALFRGGAVSSKLEILKRKKAPEKLIIGAVKITSKLKCEECSAFSLTFKTKTEFIPVINKKIPTIFFSAVERIIPLSRSHRVLYLFYL